MFGEGFMLIVIYFCFHFY